jgi:hypothetical protein
MASTGSIGKQFGGKMLTSKQVIEPGLISDELWAKVQEIIRNRWAEHGKRKKQPRFLLANLLKCSCGNSWYVTCGTHGRGSKNQRDYYYCSSRRGDHWCGSKSIQREALHQAVTEILIDRLLQVEWLEEILAGAKQQSLIDHHAPAPWRRDQEIPRIEDQRQRLIDVYQLGKITKAEFVDRVAKLDADRKAVEIMYPARYPWTWTPSAWRASWPRLSPNLSTFRSPISGHYYNVQ